MPQTSESCREQSLTNAAASHTGHGTKQSIMKTHLININTAVLRLGMFVLLLLAVQANAQTITNPNFEMPPGTVCPTAISQLSLATGWSSPTHVASSPDYFNCGLTSPVFPVTTAQNGTGYAGQFAEEAGFDFKEYIMTTLSSPMVAGKTYTINYYVKFVTGPTSLYNFQLLPVAERGYYGVMFSTTAPNATNTTDGVYGSIVNTFPAAGTGGKTLLPASDPAYSTANAWMPISLNYTAVGGEQYMTVGQFRPGAGSNPSTQSSYVYVDNFTITTPTCKTVGSTVTFTPGTNNTTAGFSTVYVLTDAAGVIQNTSIAPAGFTAPGTAGTYNIYAVNYSGTLTGNIAGSSICGVTSDVGCAVKTPTSFCVTAVACTATSIPVTVN